MSQGPWIELLDEPTTDGDGVLTIGQWGGWLVQIMPMLFNDRLVLTPASYVGAVYDYGWCYPKGGAALAAALTWNPDTEGEPAGYVKAVGWRTREAGERFGDRSL